MSSARVPLKEISLTCKGCGKDITIPIYVDDLKTQVGGLWQVSYLHNDHVITLLLDKNLALRQHRSSTIARTSREEVSARTSAESASQAASTGTASAATPGIKQEARASITLMLKTFGSSTLEFVMKPVMTGKTVIVKGDLALMEIAIATLKLFVHKKELKISWYTETFVDPREYDIIGIAPGLKEYYDTEVILDIDDKKVLNGEECDYCRKVLKGLGKMNETKAANELKDRIKNVYRSLLWMHQI